MKFVFLHRRLSPYWASCLNELKNNGNEILIVTYSFNNIAPFEIESLENLDEIIDRSLINKFNINKKIKEFNPDAIIVSGWKDFLYLNTCRNFKRKIQIILTFDTQSERGFNKEFFRGKFISSIITIFLKIYLKNKVDVAWVPGQRQIDFAKKLGFKKENCWSGVYSCDLDKYSKINILRNKPENKIKQKSFLFVGRYVDEKGLSVLFDAYKYYQSNNKTPWKLICAGGGNFPFENTLMKIENRGFIQPKNLDELFLTSSALILPSKFEPWGVIVHEATAAGLPIIISDACGSSDHLVRDNFNGYIFPSGDFISLAYKMRLLSNLDESDLKTMENNSLKLSQNYSTKKWVDTLVKGIKIKNKNA